MLYDYLMKEIFHFVDEFEMVEERQVKAFFANHGEREVDYYLQKLIVDQHRIHRVEGTNRLTSDTRVKNTFKYDAVIDALDVMTQLRAEDVNWYSVRDLPFELEFCVDNNNKLFTVSVFTQQNWVIRYEQTKRLRSLNLPIGESDPREHIAVVADESLIKKIAPLGFSMFVKIKNRDTGELEKWVQK